MKKMLKLLRLSFLLLGSLYFISCATGAKEIVKVQPELQPERTQPKSKSDRIADINKAIEYNENRLRTEPANAEVNYTLADLYLSLQDFKNANYYIGKALKSVKDRKDKEFYKAFYNRLVKETYEYCSSKNNIADYKMFLDMFYSSSYYDDVRLKLEEVTYKDIIAKNDKAMYIEFLKSFPNSSYAQDISHRLDEVGFEEAQRINSIKAYQDFLKSNPFSEFKDTILDRIDRLRFESVQLIDTIEAYSGFIQKYPANKYINDAKKNMEKLKFIRIEERKDVDKLNDYIKDNPKGVFVDVSLEKIDELNYEKAKNADTVQALEEFIQKYPASKYFEKAKKRMDILKYERVEQADTIEEYEKFLNDNPNSIFKHDASDRMEMLKKEAKINSLCAEAEKEIAGNNYDKALELFKEALIIDYSSKAHYGIGKIYEQLGDAQEDFKNIIDYYYKANTEYTVILRKDSNYNDISKVIDELMEKKSYEQQIMLSAKTRVQRITYPFSARLASSSKSPVIVFSNGADKSALRIEVKCEKESDNEKLNVKPNEEARKVFKPGKVDVTATQGEKKDKYSLELFPYYEYTLRVE